METNAHARSVAPAAALNRLVAASSDQPQGGSKAATAVEDPIANLVQAMKDIGIDTSKLTVTPRDLTNWGPNGTWVDHEFQVSTQDGKSVYLAQDLLKRNYTIGAWDVQHMLQSPYA